MFIHNFPAICILVNPSALKCRISFSLFVYNEYSEVRFLFNCIAFLTSKLRYILPSGAVLLAPTILFFLAMQGTASDAVICILFLMPLVKTQPKHRACNFSSHYAATYIYSWAQFTDSIIKRK